MSFKCHTCYTIIPDKEVEDGRCPVCGDKYIVAMCPLDHLCTCSLEIQSNVRFCERCGEPICECGSHDVVQISRVTGYLSEVSGWNKAKQQELKDRNRVTI
jgi:hypothetical protein